jgi:hypothetical protein
MKLASPGLTKRYEPVFTRLAVVKVSLRQNYVSTDTGTILAPSLSVFGVCPHTPPPAKAWISCSKVLNLHTRGEPTRALFRPVLAVAQIVLVQAEWAVRRIAGVALYRREGKAEFARKLGRGAV